MAPNIRNFAEIEKFIRENPKEADSQAFEWQQFLKANSLDSPELYSIETVEEFYEWAKKHPEKNINTSVWRGKEITDSYFYLQDQREEDQMQKEDHTNTDGASMLVDVPLLAAAFLARPKTMQDDHEYQEIEEKLKKEWLKKNPGKDFSSKEGLDYLYGDVAFDPLRTGANEGLRAELDWEKEWAKSAGVSLPKNTTLSQDAETAFRNNPKFQKKLERYDKEAKKIYGNPKNDPILQARAKRNQKHLETRLAHLKKTLPNTSLSKFQAEELSRDIEKESSEEFARKYPEKHRAYSQPKEEMNEILSQQPPTTSQTLRITEKVSSPERSSYARPSGQSGPSFRPNNKRVISTPTKGLGRNIKKPLSKIGRRLTLKSAQRTFLAFLLSSTGIWIMLIVGTFMIIAVITFIGVGMVGAPSSEISLQAINPEAQTASLPKGDFRPPQASIEVDNAIRNAVATYNLPRWFYYALVARESNFDPTQINATDGSAGTKWEGSGLTQLTGPVHHGKPYPEDLRAPDENNQKWKNDVGINYQSGSQNYGVWIKMANVTPLNNPLDPKENLDRFSTVYAVPAFFLFKQLDGGSDVEALRNVAYHWNKGVFVPYNPNDESYLKLYDKYVSEFKGLIEAQDGVWDGKPTLPAEL